MPSGLPARCRRYNTQRLSGTEVDSAVGFAPRESLNPLSLFLGIRNGAAAGLGDQLKRSVSRNLAPEQDTGRKQRGAADAGPAVNCYAGTTRKITPEPANQAKERSFIGRHGAVRDGKIDVLNPTIGTERRLLSQIKFIYFFGRKQTDENVNALGLKLRDLVSQPVATTRTRHDG
jgi:hypothetical protein